MIGVLQVNDALGFFLFEVGFEGLTVWCAMSVDYDAGSGFEFGGLVFVVGAGVAYSERLYTASLGITHMTNALSDLLSEAKQVLGRLGELEHGANTDHAAQLVNAYIVAIEHEPNAIDPSKAAHALSWHLADQLEPLPQSLEIFKLSSHARRIAKALSESHP